MTGAEVEQFVCNIEDNPHLWAGLRDKLLECHKECMRLATDEYLEYWALMGVVCLGMAGETERAFLGARHVAEYCLGHHGRLLWWKSADAFVRGDLVCLDHDPVLDHDLALGAVAYRLARVLGSLPNEEIRC